MVAVIYTSASLFKGFKLPRTGGQVSIDLSWSRKLPQSVEQLMFNESLHD